jgi:tetratricopeptide (TPR) repeat protein
MVSPEPPMPAELALRLGEVMLESGIPGLRELFENFVATANREAAVKVGRAMDAVSNPVDLFSLALDSEDPEIVSRAATHIGEAFEQDQPLIAATWYLRALSSGKNTATLVAAYRLADILESLDTRAAQQLYSGIIDSEDVNLAPAAAFALGNMLITHDPEAALAHFRTAMKYGGRESALKAAFAAGGLLADDDPDAATECFRQAMDSQDQRVASIAAARFAELQSASHPELALDAYRRVIMLGLEDFAPSAQLSIGLLHEKQGEIAEAISAYRAVYESRVDGLWPWAAFWLGGILQSDNPAEASQWFQAAIGSGDADVVPRALTYLGQLLLGSGQHAEGREILKRAVTSGHQPIVATAGVKLVLSYLEDGDPGEARAEWRRLRETGAPHLGDLMLGAAIRYGDAGSAELEFDAFSLAKECAEPEIHGLSSCALGRILSARGETRDAKAAYRDAIAGGSPKPAARAAYNLGLLLEDDDLRGARALYRSALASPEPEVSQMASMRLRLLDELERL